ncbi:MAG: Crp/Fnr family transcriptional regulator [Bacteroidota bacterium]
MDDFLVSRTKVKTVSILSLEAFKRFAAKYVDIPVKDWEIISRSFRRRELPPNYNLLEQGQVCKNLYFLESGLLRFFVIKEGIEMTKFFTIAPYCFTSQVSFNSGRRANEYIQSIESSVVWETTFQENEELLKLDSWNHFARKITQEVQFFTEEILEELQSETAENRYQRLLDNQPEMLRRIPLKHLASFFGVAPQSLSRIRKKLASQKQNLT